MAEIERELERQFHEEMLSLHEYGGLAAVKKLSNKKLTSASQNSEKAKARSRVLEELKEGVKGKATVTAYVEFDRKPGYMLRLCLGSPALTLRARR